MSQSTGNIVVSAMAVNNDVKVDLHDENKV